MLRNCPIFSAAPRICDSLLTRRVTLASVNIKEPLPALADSEEEAERRTSSEAAPKLRDAARPVQGK